MSVLTDAKLPAFLVFFLCIVGLTRLAAAAANETVFKDDEAMIYSLEAMEILYDKVKTGEYHKLGTLLGAMVDSFIEAQGIMGLAEDFFPEGSSSIITSEDTGYVLVQVMFHPEADNNADLPTPEGFESQGFEVTHCVHNVCEGYVSLENLMDISAMPEVLSITPVHKPVLDAGSVNSEGDTAMQTNTARIAFGISGAGKKIGVLSDSFGCAAGASTNYAMDVATGDLPSDVTILADITSACIDEGRAMLQLIHDVAPQAKLAFRTAARGVLDFAQGIRDLADIGCNIIVDDGEFTKTYFCFSSDDRKRDSLPLTLINGSVNYSHQPFFQDNQVAKAVDDVAGRGVAYFTSAGNSARRAWHTDRGFVSSGILHNGKPFHNFSPSGMDNFQDITLTAGGEKNVICFLES